MEHVLSSAVYGETARGAFMTYSRTSVSRGDGSPEVTGFYDADTGSIQYLVTDPKTRKAALIDTVLTFDPESATTDPSSADAILRFAQSEGIEIEWILDTHPHADHLMASSYLKDTLGKPNAIGEKVTDIATLWRDYYNLPDAFDPARDFDHLFTDGHTFAIGDLPVRVMLSPAIRWDRSPMSSVTTPRLCMTRSCSPMRARRGRIFPVEQQQTCGRLCKTSCPCPITHGCSSGMIMVPANGRSPNGKHQSRNTGATTVISAVACRKRTTSHNAKHATKRSPCPTGCCTSCK
jgi:hypothetical protein